MDHLAGVDEIARLQQQLRLESLKMLELLHLRQNQYKEARCRLNNEYNGNIARTSIHDPKLLSTRSYSVRSDSLVSEEFSSSMSAQVARQKLASASTNKADRNSKSNVLNDVENCSDMISMSESTIVGSTSSGHILKCNDKDNIDAALIDMARNLKFNTAIFPKAYEDFNASYNGDDNAFINLSGNDQGCTPEKHNVFCEGTPKSILRHRCLIDRNVHVESKYEHTPTTRRSRKARLGLNHSYTNVDDEPLAVIKSKSVNFDLNASGKGNLESGELLNGVPSRPATAKRVVQGSVEQPVSIDSMYYTGPLSLANDTATKENFSMSFPHATNAQIKSQLEGSASASTSLLFHTGNDRRNARVVCDLDKRPNSTTFADEVSTMKNRDNIRPASSGLFGESITTSQPYSKQVTSRDQAGPLLGYDWIAGLVDNEQTLADIPDDCFEEVKEFRRLNKEACIGSYDLLRPYEIGRPVTPEVENPSHTCIHGYTVNGRLFTEPVNVDDQGSSICPICRTSRKEPTEDSPGFVRVSIPRTTFAKPYKVKPHRRRSFDATDSCALSTHCLAGWECTHPTVIPTASNVDLRFATSGLRSQMTTTEDKIQNLATDYSKASRLITDEKREKRLMLDS